MSKKEDTPQLTQGSRYHIRSLASRESIVETTGTYRGIVSLGSIDSLAIEVEDDDANVRLIPTHVILQLDILEAADSDAPPTSDGDMHYT